MSLSIVISLFGGIALFLFGMTLMGDGLKKVAGNKLEIILFRLAGTPLKGFLLGIGVTAVIQSSSATSVMVVGFVNSGIMNLISALSVIIGSIIGTSVTGWVICLSEIQGTGWITLLSTSTLSAVIAVVGIVFRMFCKEQRKRHIGDILLGFAVLMYGMQAMSAAVTPLRESQQFISLMTAFSNPFIGILVGVVFAAVLQSASAAVGILQALSVTGVISFSVAFPIILGIAVGAAVPVLLSAIGARTNGKRAAYGYLIASLVGAVLCGAFFYISDAFINYEMKSMIMSPVSIALVNTLFRLISGLLQLPLVSVMAGVISSFIHESESEKAANADFDRLDDRFLAHPSLAVEQSRLTVNSMADKARTNIFDAIALLKDFSEDGFNKVVADEDLIDRYEDKIGTYLMKLNSHELERIANEMVSGYLHTISDFERISDHAVNIAEAAQEIHEKKIVFSEAAQKELQVLCSAVTEILNESIDNFISGNERGQYSVEPLEQRIDELCDLFKHNHVERMKDGMCSMNVGFVFNDLLTNFERVSDHCSNIAVAMIEISEDLFDTHGYLHELKKSETGEFTRLYKEYAEKYTV
ncbi:MAG: Na/Pi cotransporter family protein [Eubacteriales bacterium]|nr:Na/Pi cotransporter family protein [Eubacteriales bacterium]